MNWLIEIFFNGDGRPAASMPTITVQAFDEVTWFVQSERLRRFQVQLELIEDTGGWGHLAVPELPGAEDLDEEARRPVRSVLDSHQVQAVRLRVPYEFMGKRAGYRILAEDVDPAASVGYTGIITVGYRLMAMSGVPERPMSGIPERPPGGQFA